MARAPGGRIEKGFIGEATLKAAVLGDPSRYNIGFPSREPDFGSK